MNDQSPPTRQDLADQNTDKVFPDGFASDRPPEETGTALEVMTPSANRPAFGVSAVELDSAKMMAMAGPVIPAWLRANPGHCWAIIQMSKRWTKFDPATRSWIHFDPITIAQQSYLVDSGGVQTVAFMSTFVRALIDAFGNLAKPLEYRYEGENETRKVIVIGTFRGGEVREYESPALAKITPKKSPLWQSDPDRQLAYYGSRAWARLHRAAVLLGVYDIDEMEGEPVAGSADAETAASALSKRIAEHAGKNGHERTEGFRDGNVDEALRDGQEWAPAEGGKKPRGKRGAATGGRSRSGGRSKKGEGSPPGAGTGSDGQPPAGLNAGPGGAAPADPPPLKGAAGASSPEDPAKVRARAVADRAEGKRAAKPPPLPRTPAEYEAHVVAWLPSCDTEQRVEERWRSEMKLRNACSVLSEDKARIRLHVDQYIQNQCRA